MQSLSAALTAIGGLSPQRRRWLANMQFKRNFWTFFAAAFFFDAGFAVYFFLFNLYLLDLRFDDRTLGFVGSSLTTGSLLGTLAAGALSQRFGLRRMLFACFTLAPLMGLLRLFTPSPTSQIVLAFFSGVAMCLWGVCFLPAVARLTTESNRATGFGLIYAVSVGTAGLGGTLSGYLPGWLNSAGWALEPSESKRLILFFSCCVAFLGILPLRRLAVPDGVNEAGSALSWRLSRGLPSTVLLLIPVLALWSGISSAFALFAHVHLTRDLHIPLRRVGVVFSTAQFIQLCCSLLTPLLFGALGLVRGIAATQLAAALGLAFMSSAHTTGSAIPAYLVFTGAQWMGSPGLYNLLMTETPDGARSSAAALALFCNSLAGAVASAAMGTLLARFGYGPVLLGIAALCVVVPVLLVSTYRRRPAHSVLASRAYIALPSTQTE